ncbi:MAG TPA: EMC3/TMCO1 family protein [archaeon]|nr:EMC3/TMCO1 family protein [archaeon]
MLFGAMVDIALITAVLYAISQTVQNKFMNKDDMKRHQEEIKIKQGKMKELMKKEDQKSKNELETLEREMMETMQKMMSGSSKVMLVSMVLFLPALWILGAFYGEAIIKLPIPLPWLSNGFDLFSIGTWGVAIYNETNWFGWYFVCFLVLSVIVNIFNGLRKKVAVIQNG